MNLKDFLKNSDRDIYILGNQSADLDSTVSAYSLSVLLSSIDKSGSYQALIQGDRDDIKLKPEITALFQRVGIPLESLKYTSDLKMEELTEKSVILVDHNSISKNKVNFNITGIIDHHADSGLYRDLLLRDIRICGSCCSIISQYWGDADTDVPYSHQLLLAGTIGIDTGFLNKEWGKTTDLDREQYHRNQLCLSPEDQSFLETLLEIKDDLGHLTLLEHLKRDYKDLFFSTFHGGISSVPLCIKDFFDDRFFKLTEVESFCMNTCPDFLIILHTLKHPFQREISLYIPESVSGNSPGNQIRKALLSLKSICRLSESRETDDKWFYFDLEDPRISRKILTPLLQKELNT